MIFKKRKYDPVTQLLRELHWLPAKKRIEFKTLLMAYKSVHEPDFPSYLKDMITLLTSTQKSTRPKRPHQQYRLVVPKTKLKCGENAHSTAQPHYWNKLHYRTQASSSITIYKSALKTILFDNWLMEKHLL